MQTMELRKIQTIWRFWIAKRDIRAILGEAKSYTSSEDKVSFIEYRPEATTNDSGFIAIVGCPTNGSGVVRMLLDH